MEDRYARQKILAEIGESGQQRLLDAQVVIVGCGGLGGIAAAYLAGAGVGRLTLIDADRPSVSNLHRQVFFSSADQKTKAVILQEKLQQLNPDIEITACAEYLTKHNIDELLTGADLVMECTDDIFCKYLTNDFCVLESIPLIYGAIHKYEGYVSLFVNGAETDIHLRDLFSDPDPNTPVCSEVGVMNTIAGIIGLLQANEAIKYILGIGEPLAGKLLTYNSLTNQQLIIQLSKTYNSDLTEVYEQSNYDHEDGALVPEITAADIGTALGSYSFISVMPPHEHQAISPDTVRLDLTAMSEYELKAAVPTIVYCRTGRTSKKAVAQWLAHTPTAKIFSLKGGFLAYQRFMAAH